MILQCFKTLKEQQVITEDNGTFSNNLKNNLLPSNVGRTPFFNFVNSFKNVL